MKKRLRKSQPASAEKLPGAGRPKSTWPWIALIAVCVTAFYWTPLTSPEASIQWDAADMHYPLQKYFSDHLRSGRLPFWTPYVFSGYPFLANPEVAAWYLPHWPLYLAGMNPRAIQLELALHAFLACLGAYLLIMRHVRNRAAAVLGAFCYGLSGFFAGHSSHVGIFATAAGLPWLLLCFRSAFDGPALVRSAAFGGVVGGLLVLAGYAQAALYAFFALGIYALSAVWEAPRRWPRALAAVAGMLVLSAAIASVQIVPTLELAPHSIRAGLDFSTSTEGALHPKSLATLLSPNSLGAIEGEYTGPADITQHYLYAGLLLLPLAAFGLMRPGVRLPALFLIVPAIWYMLGPAAGLYRLAALLSPLSSFRAPVQGWFVAALGLALLAAGGFHWMQQRWRVPFLAPIILAFFFGDLWYWNSWANPLAYARASYESLYGRAERVAAREVASRQPPLTRFDAPPRLTALGPLDHPLNLRLEATYGYFAMELAAYGEYAGAMQSNHKLRDGLNVGRVLNLETGRIESNASVSPRAYFPPALKEATSPAETRELLAGLDPAAWSTVLAPPEPVRQDPHATAEIVSHDDRRYRIRYRAATPSVLRLSVPWFPGWRASAGGRDCTVVRVDHALLGIIVPEGEHELLVEFHSNYFSLALAISLAGLAAAGAIIAFHHARKPPSRIRA